MRVVCTTNDGRNLSAKHFESGYTSSTVFDLKVGKEYVVYAISLWKGFLSYLVVGEGSFPQWYPSGVFSITRSDLPLGWYFANFKEEEGFQVNAVWGYEELVNSESHFDELSNLEKSAIDIFVKRKRQIDEVS
jgi:hypothetical protein